ncbi:MAG TPA: hypothetical protein VF122_03480 [Caulobacteraceae bacterium]
MGWFKATMIGLSAAVSVFAAGSARAGDLELIYWDTGKLEWFQVDGVSYTLDDNYSVTVKNIYNGSHTLAFGANGTSRSFSVYLSDDNATDPGHWCVDLRLETHEFLDGWDCEDMWDYYMFGD